MAAPPTGPNGITSVAVQIVALIAVVIVAFLDAWSPTFNPDLLTGYGLLIVAIVGGASIPIVARKLGGG
jgi:hypothetical protein